MRRSVCTVLEQVQPSFPFMTKGRRTFCGESKQRRGYKSKGWIVVTAIAFPPLCVGVMISHGIQNYFHSPRYFYCSGYCSFFLLPQGFIIWHFFKFIFPIWPPHTNSSVLLGHCISFNFVRISSSLASQYWRVISSHQLHLRIILWRRIEHNERSYALKKYWNPSIKVTLYSPKVHSIKVS